RLSPRDRPLARSALCPYTTLFRSGSGPLRDLLDYVELREVVVRVVVLFGNANRVSFGERVEEFGRGEQLSGTCVERTKGQRGASHHVGRYGSSGMLWGSVVVHGFGAVGLDLRGADGRG